MNATIWKKLADAHHEIANVFVDEMIRPIDPATARACVYFIQGEDGGPIKIGFTRYLPGRLADLQASSPARLRVVAASEGGRDVEGVLHDRFAKHRLHGEWFAPYEELVAFVESIRARTA